MAPEATSGQRAPTGKRPKPAQEARTVATGVAACAFFGLVLGMGMRDVANPSTAPAAPAAVVREQADHADPRSTDPAAAPIPAPPATTSGAS